MKKIIYLFIIAFSLVIISCDGLGKMVKGEKAVTYNVTPNPLEMKGDSVKVTITANYPAKFFFKKAHVEITPVLKYTGGEEELPKVVLVGEASTESGQKISFNQGGSLNYVATVPFKDAMRNSELELRAVGKVKTKAKQFTPMKIADGVIATSLLFIHDEKTIAAKDSFAKSQPSSVVLNTYFEINQSVIRSSETKKKEYKTIENFIKTKTNSSELIFNNISVSAYASPDGELRKNENLAKDRAKVSTKNLQTIFNFNKDKTKTFGKLDSNYKVLTISEDWDGFKSLMETSSIADKDLILRVLTMYPDGEQREKEIKNLAATYTEIADKILPKLRRSVITINYTKTALTDEQIIALLNSNLDTLSKEEILYGVKLLSDNNLKINALKHASTKYSNDWRTHNNLGVALVDANKITEASEAFLMADKIQKNQLSVLNNLGVIASKMSNRKQAVEYYNKAKSAGNEVNYNLGIIKLQEGNYDAASAAFASYTKFNKALVELLKANPTNAESVLNNSTDKDTALGLYLKAIIANRIGSTESTYSNLKSAIAKDAKFKLMATDDAEFLNLRKNQEFIEIVK